jgi:hypothetical protein
MAGQYVVSATVEAIAGPAVFPMHNVGWYVSPEGDNVNNCQSVGAPCLTIGGALSKAEFVRGDMVLVRAGNHQGSGPEVALIDKDVRLSGGWDSGFTVREGSSVLDGQGARRGLTVAEDVSATVEGFVIENGYSASGGGIENLGDLTLLNSRVINNIAFGEFPPAGGGGITNQGDLILQQCEISHNESIAIGGGVINSGNISMSDCEIANNVGSQAGGIYNGGYLTAYAITVRDNWTTYSTGKGGGLFNGNAGEMYLNNSTISGNQSNNSAGIYNGDGHVSLNSNTISNNTSSHEPAGVRNQGQFATFSMQNSIVADNVAAHPGEPGHDCGGVITSAGYNLLGDSTDCEFLATTGDLLDLDPRLFRLLGYPAYHPLMLSSPAIDSGDPGGCTDHLGSSLLADQRGISREGRCDVGAYEYDPEHDPLSYAVIPVILNNFCPGFFDDFSNPNSGWPAGDHEYYTYGYLSGEYQIRSKRAGYFYLFESPSCRRENYVVEVDARWVGATGSGYGILFGIVGDFDRYYLFDVNTDSQMYRLLYRSPSGWRALVDPTTSGAINRGNETNHLKVIRNGSEITLGVNGTTLRVVNDSRVVGLAGAGIVSQPYDDRPSSDARFDNFSMVYWSANGVSNKEVVGDCLTKSSPSWHQLEVTPDLAAWGE